jgi:hypothetical protein
LILLKNLWLLLQTLARARARESGRDELVRVVKTQRKGTGKKIPLTLADG